MWLVATVRVLKVFLSFMLSWPRVETRGFFISYDAQKWYNDNYDSSAR